MAPNPIDAKLHSANLKDAKFFLGWDMPGKAQQYVARVFDKIEDVYDHLKSNPLPNKEHLKVSPVPAGQAQELLGHVKKNPYTNLVNTAS